MLADSDVFASLLVEPGTVTRWSGTSHNHKYQGCNVLGTQQFAFEDRKEKCQRKEHLAIPWYSSFKLAWMAVSGLLDIIQFLFDSLSVIFLSVRTYR